MISIETVVAMAVRNPVVMDGLGEALRSDLVLSNPYYRRIVEFADDFMTLRRQLPGGGDWTTWIDSLTEGPIRDGTREALGRLFATDVSGHQPEFFAEQAIVHLRKAAAHVAVARMNEMRATIEPEVFVALSKKLEAVESGGLRGLARLKDVDTWANPVREGEYTPTGYPTLDRLIGGWGKELWMVFADTGVGKSMLLQNFASAMAVRGKRVLHVTLELGIRPQIHRYYRQIAMASRSEFSSDIAEVKRRLIHAFRLAKGEVWLIEYPAYGLDHEQLRRVIEKANRSIGQIDVLILDYLDLLTVAKGQRGKGGAYEDLGRLTHETRDMCRAYDITVLTATQSVRRPESAGRLTVRDMGDSYKKVQGADGLLSLVQTDEEEEAYQGRLGVLKVRDSGGRGTEIGLYINRELSVIAELEHANTKELMRRLEHLPEQLAQKKPQQTIQ